MDETKDWRDANNEILRMRRHFAEFSQKLKAAIAGDSLDEIKDKIEDVYLALGNDPVHLNLEHSRNDLISLLCELEFQMAMEMTGNTDPRWPV